MKNCCKCPGHPDRRAHSRSNGRIAVMTGVADCHAGRAAVEEIRKDREGHC